MKLLIFTPLWKRPEIVREWVRSLERLPEHELLVVMSPEDPHYDELIDILPGCAWRVDCKNTPFGAKKNAGIEGARQLNWDYLMELNSDSIVNPAIFDLYSEHIAQKCPFFGLKNHYCVDYNTKKSLYLPSYNDGMTFGSGRMIHRGALVLKKMWVDELNEGMDTNMITRLRKAGIHETVIDNKEPMIVDLKTNTTIWHFTELEQMGQHVDYEYLVKQIGYDFISS